MNKIKSLQLNKVSFASLLIFLLLFVSAGIIEPSFSKDRLRVGFDLDDTLLFSTPAFNKGFRSVHSAWSPSFWTLVNKSDVKHSVVKESVRAILDKHRNQGDDIYIITARRPYGTAPLLDYLEKTFHVEREWVFFEPKGKSQRMKALGLDIFYGDSDTDISDALDAGVRGIRIRRSPKSWHKKNYHPGKFNEPILENTE
jgi:acid phosphatase (class B)